MWITTNFFDKQFAAHNEWTNHKGVSCKGKGFDFVHENEHEIITFFVPLNAYERAHERNFSTDALLFVWEEFITSTSYLDFITEGTQFLLVIDGQYLCPMSCTRMDEKHVEFHLHTVLNNGVGMKESVIRRVDTIIDCTVACGRVVFEEKKTAAVAKAI